MFLFLEREHEGWNEGTRLAWDGGGLGAGVVECMWIVYGWLVECGYAAMNISF